MTLLHIWQHHYDSDFAAGVRLLSDHNPGVVTKAILARLQMLAVTGNYVGEYEKGKLAYALSQSPVEAPLYQAPLSPPKGGKGVVRHGIPVNLTQESDAPSPLGGVGGGLPSGGTEGGLTSPHAKALHKEHAHIHALMVAASTDEERAAHARDIMERIIPALDAEYDRLRAQSSDDSKSSDDSDDSKSSDDSDAIGRPILNAGDARAFKKLQSVRSRISTLRGKVQKEKDPDKKARWEAELEKKIAERERLENELS